MWSERTLGEMRLALLDWYQRHARPLPWRMQSGIYPTVVSEFMCQQTQIDTVLPYFARWMTRWPDFEALAGAAEEEVVKMWEGLGYYSRARRLHALAQRYIASNQKPQTAEQWQHFPGIGPYTAAAIASITAGEPVAVVDGNVVRVLARLRADDKEYDSGSRAAAVFQPIANKFLNHEHPGAHNQAMMELGATVCIKFNPLCLLCPLAFACEAVKSGDPQRFPRLKRRETINRVIHRIWLINDGKLLLSRRPDNSRRLARVFELPPCVRPPDQSIELMRRQRGISNERITEIIHSTSILPDAFELPPGEGELFWIELNQLDALTLSGPHRKWIQQLLTTVQQ